MSRCCGAFAAVSVALSSFLGLVGAPVAATEPAQVALSYEQNEDRAGFIAQVRKARQGDAESQWQVGFAYAKLGEPERALPMLQSAAASGHSRAAALLGRLAEDGRGGARNIAEAKRWYGYAAERGEPDAMAALGRLLLADGSPQAREAALPLLRESAKQNDPDGQYYLGWLLVQPSAASRDDVQAYELFLKAARQGHVGAQLAAAAHLLAGRGVAVDRKAAGDWLERAAKQREPIALYLLGRLNEEEGGQAGLDRARNSFRVAAVAGHREAQFRLAALLAKSVAEADRKEAVEWFAKAHQAGHKAAANRLGEAYRDGIGVLQQMEKARSFFQQAAEQGDANAMYNLAQMQNEGLGGLRDTDQALKWLARAADGGHGAASELVERLLSSSVKTSAFGLKGFWQ
jgi:TPR repeat protein